MKFRLVILFTLCFFSCEKEKHPDLPLGSFEELFRKKVMADYQKVFEEHPDFIAKGFDYPVGAPDGKGYYNAQGFLKNNHLGDDWNAVTGGDSDFGHTFYAIADGYVFFTRQLGKRSGWGKVIRLVHKMEEQPLEYVESLYAHCDQMLVKEGDLVKKGDKIGTIGNAEGLYKSHLHFEMRHDLFMTVGSGYSSDYEGYLNPSLFLEAHRELE